MTKTETKPSFTQALTEALERASGSDAPPLTLLHPASTSDTAETEVVDLTDPVEALTWLKAELDRGALDLETPGRAVTWVPGGPRELDEYVPLFAFLQELGYRQTFEFGSSQEVLGEWLELLGPLTDMDAVFTDNHNSATLAPSETPTTDPDAEPGKADEPAQDGAGPTQDDDGFYATEQPAPHDPEAEAAADADTRTLIKIVVGTFVLAAVLIGGFSYLASQHEKQEEGASAVKQRDADTAYQEGVAAKKRGEVAAAEQHLRRCLEIEPGRIKAAAELGALLSEVGRDEEALAVYARAFATPGTSAPDELAQLHANHGDALLRMKRYQDAVTAYDQAVEFVPQARLNRIGALIELKDFHNARESLEKLLTGEVSPGMRAKLGRLKAKIPERTKR